MELGIWYYHGISIKFVTAQVMIALCWVRSSIIPGTEQKITLRNCIQKVQIHQVNKFDVTLRFV